VFCEKTFFGGEGGAEGGRERETLKQAPCPNGERDVGLYLITLRS